ncbi:MAG: branched-chain amino acid transport system permease protein [Bacillota bacterium]|nr:branched-chain amino acid transport system permease protein [Bacillota bacterium]
MLLAQLLNGLILGTTYALIALGYTMVYGILGLINFAHGEIYMAGAFLGLFLTAGLKLPFLLAFPLATGGAAVLGVIVERVAYRPLRNSPRLSALISAIGVSIFLQNLTLTVAGPATRPFPRPFGIRVLTLPAGLSISSLQLFIISVAVLLMLGLDLLIRRTAIGRAMRATAQDLETARLMGINVDRVIALTFAIGSALGAAAGILIGLYFNSVDPLMGFQPGLKGFVAAVLGGIGNIPGAMLGGLLLGFAEVLGAVYFSQYRDAIAFAILIFILLVRPTGILGSTAQDKV